MKKLPKSLALAFLLCALGVAMSTLNASEIDNDLPQDHAVSNAGSLHCGTSAQDGTCYTIDTSRPEWLGRFVYLPVVQRDNRP
jgi:hypothetical protein